LSGLRLITQPRSDVGHSADSGVIETSLEADCAERRKPVRYADAETNLVPEAAPRRRQSSDCVTHFRLLHTKAVVHSVDEAAEPVPTNSARLAQAP
jgi:hypothetical protein